MLNVIAILLAVTLLGIGLGLFGLGIYTIFFEETVMPEPRPHPWSYVTWIDPNDPR